MVKKKIDSEFIRRETVSVDDILAFVDVQMLHTFLLEYAEAHPEFEKALLKRFLPVKVEENQLVDYRKLIEECFVCSPRRSRSHHYDRYDDYEEVDFYEISEKLGQYLKKAEVMMDQKIFDDAASIALNTLRSIAEHHEDEHYYAIYDDFFDLCTDCEMAGCLLRLLAKNAEVDPSLKTDALNELCSIAKLEAYTDYCIYEIDDLVKDFNLSSQTKENSLKLIEKMISEADASSYKACDLVKQKIDLLTEMRLYEEVEKTIEQYISEPRIRKLKIETLLGKHSYAAAIQCIDDGICIAKQNGYPGTVNEWMRDKLQIYQQTNNIPEIIFSAQALFVGNRGGMQYYEILKNHVPSRNWKVFLEELMNKAALNTQNFFGSSAAADIYVVEKDEKRLMELLRSTSSREQLDMLIEYDSHLKQNYSAELLDIYAARLKEYAERNMGRNHYEYVARILTIMLKLTNGKKAVDELVTLFRSIYKRRPAMMELIRKF